MILTSYEFLVCKKKYGLLWYAVLYMSLHNDVHQLISDSCRDWNCKIMNHHYGRFSCQILPLFYKELLYVGFECKRPMSLYLYWLKRALMSTQHSSPYQGKYIKMHGCELYKLKKNLYHTKMICMGTKNIFYILNSQYFWCLKPNLKQIWAKNASGQYLSEKLNSTGTVKYQ